MSYDKDAFVHQHAHQEWEICVICNQSIISPTRTPHLLNSLVTLKYGTN